MPKYFFIVYCLFCVMSCSNQAAVPTAENADSTAVEAEMENEEDGPPFNDTCRCSFRSLGKIKVGKERQDLFLSGKGWDWASPSCVWTWQEIFNNEFPDDSIISDFRIHLMDTTGIEIDTTFLQSSIFSKKLIATYHRKNDQCIYDPHKTGKYPKPVRWTEE